jgi:hypothetical protein
MPKYRITGPDGGTYEIEAPEGANEQDVLSFAQKQFSKPAATPAPNQAAPSSGVVMGLRDPIDAGAQMLRRLVPEGAAQAVDKFGNWLADKGLPVARSDGVEGVDKIVRDVNQGYEANRAAAGESGFDGARLVGNLANPANYIGGAAVKGATTVAQLARGGAIAGAASAAMQPVTKDTDNFWSQKGEQAATGAITGAIATPVIAKGAEKVVSGINRALPVRPVSPQRIEIMVNNTLRSEGLQDAPDVIRQSVRRQVEEAMQQGHRLDAAAMVRRAQFEAVGLTDDAAPTLGQLTRDPMQWANEKNLSGVRVQTPRGEGNPLADRFQAQNNRLQEVFNRVGASDATDKVTAGQTIMEGLRQTDVPVRRGVDEAYTAARAMTGGRAAELDRAAFSQAANRALDDGMWGHFVPPEVRGILNDISAGKTPFTVETAEQVDSILSAAQRRAGQGSPQASAIGVIRRALHDAPFVPPQAATFDAGAAARAAADDAARTVDEGVQDVTARMVTPTALPGQPALPGPGPRAVSTGAEFDLPPQMLLPGPAGAAPINEGAAAREAFAQARAAARNRFATIEATPALRAALDNEAPDRFVQNYIINADVRDVEAMRNVLANSPEALAQARAQLAEHLRFAAFRSNASGDGGFNAQAYNNLLRAVGPQKLAVFFSPAEIMQLNLAGRVASDITTKPAGATYATNTSGTGAAVMNLLSRLANSSVLRNIPGARALSNHAGEIQTEQAIRQALTAQQPAQQARELSPETMRALQLLFPPAGVAGGVLGGASVN